MQIINAILSWAVDGRLHGLSMYVTSAVCYAVWIAIAVALYREYNADSKDKQEI